MRAGYRYVLFAIYPRTKTRLANIFATSLLFAAPNAELVYITSLDERSGTINDVQVNSNCWLPPIDDDQWNTEGLCSARSMRALNQSKYEHPPRRSARRHIWEVPTISSSFFFICSVPHREFSNVATANFFHFSLSRAISIDFSTSR